MKIFQDKQSSSRKLSVLVRDAGGTWFGHRCGRKYIVIDCNKSESRRRAGQVENLLHS